MLHDGRRYLEPARSGRPLEELRAQTSGSSGEHAICRRTVALGHAVAPAEDRANVLCSTQLFSDGVPTLTFLTTILVFLWGAAVVANASLHDDGIARWPDAARETQPAR